MALRSMKIEDFLNSGSINYSCTRMYVTRFILHFHCLILLAGKERRVVQILASLTNEFRICMAKLHHLPLNVAGVNFSFKVTLLKVITDRKGK